MKAKDKKAIAVLEAEIKALLVRESAIEKFLDDLYDNHGVDAWKASVAELDDEYSSIGDKVNKKRDEIRKIKDADIYARGLGHSLELARANID